MQSPVLGRRAHLGRGHSSVLAELHSTPRPADDVFPSLLPHPLQQFQAALFISVSLGVLITYAIALCATVNSPLATTVTGNMKDVVCTGFGWAIFGGFDKSLWNIGGLTLSFAGAALYSREKLVQALKPEPLGSGATAAKLASMQGDKPTVAAR